MILFSGKTLKLDNVLSEANLTVADIVIERN